MEGLSLRSAGDDGRAGVAGQLDRRTGSAYGYASPEPMNEKEAVDFAKTISG